MSDGLALGGSLWLPESGLAHGLLLMHPGSGASDRDNDVLFPPIRAAVLAREVAVCSFDKRGVGASEGRWTDAGILTQAADLLAGLAAARAALLHAGHDGPVGLFGHSQGGWVVLEAARSAPVAFVITNSGPAVSPAEQERFATRNRLLGAGWSDDDIGDGLSFLDLVFELVDSQPFDTGAAALRANQALAGRLAAVGTFLPDVAELWAFAKAILRHDPRHALQSLTVPLLALYGARDVFAPVTESTARLRSLVDPRLLDIRVLPSGDHRLQEPDSDHFAPGYLRAIADFVEAHCRS